MRLQACASLLAPHAAWAALFMTAVASAASPTTTTLSSTGNNPYSLTATVTTTGLPSITGSVAFADQTNGYTLNSSSLSAPVITQSFLPPAFVQGKPRCNDGCNAINAVLTGDFNGDRKPDLAMFNTLSSDITVKFGNGDGTFGQSVSSPIGIPDARFVTGDFDGDGKLDLLTVNADTSTIVVLFGDGAGSFTRQASTPTAAGQVSPDDISVADLNGDGKFDVALRPFVVGDPLRIYLGRGDGTFLAPLPYSVVPFPYYLSFGDFNGDGKLDIAHISRGAIDISGMYVGLGRGDGTFNPSATSYQFTDGNPDAPRRLPPLAKVQGDFNGDGKLDQLVFTPAQSFMMLGNGDGTFQQVMLDAQANNSGFAGAAVPADFNGDGKLDVLLTITDGSTFLLYLGNGDGTLQRGPINPVLVGFGATSVDLNGDGTPDVVGKFENYTNGSLDAVVTLNRLVQTATATLPNANIIGTGLHNVTASYTGDPSHSNSSASLSLAALRVTTSLQLTPSATSVPFRGTVNLSAALNPRSAQNLAAGGLVTFSATGSPAPLGTASLNAQGVATLPNITLPLGANSITAQYAGDTNFANANSTPVSVTVNPTGAAPANGLSCNGAYTGTFNGSITVLPGQYCEFSGGTVRGNLTSIGGAVVLRNTVVTGNVQILGPAAIRGPAQHAICGSTVQGNVEVAGAFDPVMIGGTTAACAASRIGGNLKLQLNARQASLQVTNTAVGGNLEAQLNGGALTLSGDTVSGNLSVQNNIGGVTVTGNRVGRNMEVERNSPTAVVTANQVTGNLQCSSNTGISGSGNTARQKQGQCAVF